MTIRPYSLTEMLDRRRRISEVKESHSMKCKSHDGVCTTLSFCVQDGECAVKRHNEALKKAIAAIAPAWLQSVKCCAYQGVCPNRDLCKERGGCVALRGGVDEAERVIAESSKPFNPKDAIGSDKVPMHLWPKTASVMGALALCDGALKYGRANWRHAGVRASIYYDALERHMSAWFEGEDNDPDSGLPHLGHALACIAIIVDAQAANKLTDDRQTPGGYRDLITNATPHVADAKARHSDKAPKHYTIADARA